MAAPAPPRGLSAWRGFATLLKCNWGIGMMAMPYYLSLFGLAGGILFFLVTMVLTYHSIACIMDCRDAVRTQRQRQGRRTVVQQRSEEGDNSTSSSSSLSSSSSPSPPASIPGTVSVALESFSGLIGAAMDDDRWELLSVACIVLGSGGSCIAYVEFVKDNMSKFVGLDPWVWALIMCVTVLPLCLRDDIASLSVIALLGLLASSAFVVVLLYDVLMNVSLAAFVAFLRTSPQLESNLPSLAVALGLAVFCNEGIVVISPSAEHAMVEPDKFRHWVLAPVIGFFFVVYMIVAVCGLVLYGRGSIESELALNLDPSQLHDRVAIVFYSLQLLPTFCVVYFVACEATEDALFRLLRRDPLGRQGECARSFHMRLRVLGCRAVGVALIGVLALQVPNFGVFLALIGGAANSILIYILPHLCFLRLFPSRQGDESQQQQHSDTTPLLHASALGSEPLDNKDITAPRFASWQRRCTSWSVLLFGIASGLVTTFVSIAELTHWLK